MTLIKTGIIALALTASLGALATSASAATRAERNAAAREARAQAQDYRVQQQQRYVPSPVGGYYYNDTQANQSSSPGCYTQGNYGHGVDESACNQ
jgi:type II secretory pathway pseudopilin PulG